MSATREEEMRDGMPPVPGAAALGWLLLMRPLMLRRLLEAWGFAGFVKWSALGQCVAEGDEVARALRRRTLAWVALYMPACGLVALALAAIGGVEVRWSVVDGWWVFSFVFVFVMAMFTSWGFVLVMGGLYVSLVTVGRAVDDEGLVAACKGLTLGTALLIDYVLRGGRAPRWWHVVLVAGGIAVISTYMAWDKGRWLGLMEGIGLLAAGLRLPLLVIEVPLMLGLRVMQWRDPAAGPRLARWLPYRWDDLILMPLPGLRGFLVALAARDRALAEVLIEEAAGSVGQQGVALRAWAALGGAPGGPALAGA